MARARQLKPDFFKNEALGGLPPLVRLLFAGLWCWADREGRLEDRPLKLRAEILPYDALDAEKALADLAAAGLVVRYESGGRRYLALPTFAKHQRCHPNEPRSEIPAPPKEELGSPMVNQVAPSENHAAPTGANGEPDCALPSLPSLPSQEDPPNPPGGGGFFSEDAPAAPRRKNAGRKKTPAGFAEFWAAWPLKVAREAAERAWAALSPDGALRAVILAAVEAQKAERAAFAAVGAFHADWTHPATWLNQKRWQDEPRRPPARASPRGVAPPPPSEAEIAEDVYRRRAAHAAELAAGARPPREEHP